jgi:hypothetical protein
MIPDAGGAVNPRNSPSCDFMVVLAHPKKVVG